MTLENYVKLVEGVEKVLKIREGTFRIEPRTVLDPKTKAPTPKQAAVMDVYEEDGRGVQKQFSTLSDKLATQLKAAHDNRTLYTHNVGIKKVGSGYVTEYALRLF
jgi:hypothetical protein